VVLGKKQAVSLGLDSIYVYRSEETTKLRSSLLLKSVVEMEVINEDGMPNSYGVKVLYGSEQDVAIFSFMLKEEAEKWMDELNWRVQAIHRVFKYDDASSDEESASMGGRRRKKDKEKSQAPAPPAKSNKFSLTKKSRKK